MKIKSIHHVTPAPNSHVKKFDRFVELIRDASAYPLYFPKARGTRKKLVPPPRKKPCDLCAVAQYNKICERSRACAPMLYYTFAKLDETSLKKFASEK